MARLRAYLRRRVPALAIALAVVALAGLGAPLWWGLELLTHFALQQLVLALLVAATCADLREWRWAAVALAPVALGSRAIAPAFVPMEVPTALGRPLRVMSFNMHGGTDNAHEVASFVAASECDVVVLLEVRSGMEEALQGSGYRVAASELRMDNFGVALLTRVPDLEADLVRMPDGDVPAVQATLTWDGDTWHLLGVHTWPPLGGHLARVRNDGLRFAATWARGEGRRVVLGDLNVTPYSPHFDTLLAEGRLVDSRRGHGIQSSWPQWPWLLTWAQVPIDHVLHDQGTATLSRRVGPSLGSDHRSVIATLAAIR